MRRTLSNGLGWSATLIACLGMAMVAFSGCASVKHSNRPPCVSRCGMLLEDVDNGAMSCEDLQKAEDAVLGAYDELKDKDPRLAKDEMCKAIFGWQLHLSKNVVGTYDGQTFFLGVSDCNSKEMTLFANKDWRSGSYSHEIVHVAQSCRPPDDWLGSEDEERGNGHRGWEENGVDAIIREFKRGYR